MRERESVYLSTHINVDDDKKEEEKMHDPIKQPMVFRDYHMFFFFLNQL